MHTKAKLTLIPLGLAALLLWLFWGGLPKEVETVDIAVEKQRGAHVFGIGDSTDLTPIKDANIEWLTLVPWGFQTDYKDKDVGHHNGDSLAIKRYNDFWVRRIKHVKKSGYKVFVKPHVWVDTTVNGKWRSDIFPETQKDWKSWSASYRGFIIRYAQVAEAGGAEMFCVGMELTRLALEKPLFWRELIAEVRKVYKGKLVYGANWSDAYKDISFWDDLDYIGVQAYFPLADIDNPSEAEISEAWNTYLPDLAAVSEQFDRKILFTEIGYKSTANAAIKPWEWAENPESEGNIYSAETQLNCYRAFFNTVWNQPWMAGVYFWQLRIDYDGNPYYDLDFTPQGKPAIGVLVNGFNSNSLKE